METHLIVNQNISWYYQRLSGDLSWHNNMLMGGYFVLHAGRWILLDAGACMLRVDCTFQFFLLPTKKSHILS